MATQPPTVQPGALYGVPGVTQRFEQFDSTQDAITNLQQSAIVPWNNVNSFQKTDVVHWWDLDVTWTNSYVLGTEVVALSPHAPYNLLQPVSVQMQGQYKPVDVVDAFDLAFFQMYRPMRGAAQQANNPLLGANPQGTYANSAIPQANLAATPNMAANTTPVSFSLELPGCLWFDQYWDLAEDGTVLAPPISAYVSPQYMGGGERIVTPKVKFAPGFVSSSDQGPLYITSAGTVTSYSSSVAIDVRRNGVYASNNPAEMPPVFNWQYQRHSFQVPVGAANKIDIPITDYGQILSTYVRLYDPATGNGGSVPSVSNISKAQLLYGSNLPRFDDTPVTAQRRFLNQHGFLPPQGTIAWDMALTDTGGYITNAKAINTLTNANVKAHLEFSTPMSSQGYAIVGVESLVYVAIQ